MGTRKKSNPQEKKPACLKRLETLYVHIVGANRTFNAVVFLNILSFRQEGDTPHSLDGE